MTQGEVATGMLGSNAARAISPCVMDDRAGGRRVPPNTSAAPPFSALDGLLRRLADSAAPALPVPAKPRLRLVGEPGIAPIGGGARLPRVVELYERHVAGALQAVESRERECIELTYFDGLTVDEVAARCAMSVDAVDDRLRRGLNDMLRYLRARARQEAGAQR